MVKMDGFQDKVILITGGSRGLGRILALDSAKKGARLVLLAKTQGALEAVDDEIKQAQAQAGLKASGAVLVPFDLNQPQHFDGLAYNLFDRFGRLDAIIGNAAILGELTPLSHIAPDDFDKVMRINFTANYRLIRASEPLLRQADYAHALFISCPMAKVPKAFWATYCASKAALQAMVDGWSEELGQTNIKAGWIDPGLMATRIMTKAYPGKANNSWPQPEEKALAACLEFLNTKR